MRSRRRPCGRTAKRSSSCGGRPRSRDGCSRRSRRSGRSASGLRGTAWRAGSGRSRRRTTRPCRSTITIRPGIEKLATSTRPPGRSCASEGYGTGERIDQRRRPSAARRSIQPPISVTRRPPSARGVSPFGLSKPRGGSWTQLPPRTRATLPVCRKKTIRQLRMSGRRGRAAPSLARRPASPARRSARGCFRGRRCRPSPARPASARPATRGPGPRQSRDGGCCRARGADAGTSLGTSRFRDGGCHPSNRRRARRGRAPPRRRGAASTSRQYVLSARSRCRRSDGSGASAGGCPEAP